MSRSRCRPAAAGVLLAVLLPFGAVSCGVTDEEAGTTTQAPTTTEPETAKKPVRDWAVGVCDGLTVWSDEFDTLSEDFDAELETVEEGDVAGVRDLLADFFGQAAETTLELGNALEEVGAPDLDQGEQIAIDLRQNISKVQGELTDTKNQVADLPVDDPQEFKSEIDRLNEEFQEALDEIAAALDDFESRYDDDGAEIDRVLSDDRVCPSGEPGESRPTGDGGIGSNTSQGR